MYGIETLRESELQEVLRTRVEWVLENPTQEFVQDIYAIRAALDEIARGKKYARALADKFKCSDAVAFAEFLTD